MTSLTRALLRARPRHPGVPWPSPLREWLQACARARGDYAMGLGGAGVLASALWPWSPAAAWAALALAGLGVLASVSALFLIHGPPSSRIFDRLFVGLRGDERVLDVHLGAWRGSREALERLLGAEVRAVDLSASASTRGAERPPLGHPRFSAVTGRPDALRAADEGVDLVLLGYGLAALPEADRAALEAEVLRVLAPGGRVLRFERARRPLLGWLRGREQAGLELAGLDELQRGVAFGMVALRVAQKPQGVAATSAS